MNINDKYKQLFFYTPIWYIRTMQIQKRKQQGGTKQWPLKGSGIKYIKN